LAACVVLKMTIYGISDTVASGRCCAEASYAGCEVVGAECPARFEGGSNRDDAMAEACFAYCQAMNQAPGWCPSELDACIGSDDSPVTHGKCCGQYPDAEDCAFVASICKPFREEGTVPENGDKKETEEACDAECDAHKSKPAWCASDHADSGNSGLSTGSIAGIVIAGVVVVGVVVGLLVYFLVIRKNVNDASAYRVLLSSRMTRHSSQFQFKTGRRGPESILRREKADAVETRPPTNTNRIAHW
jgi:hypothetical protein